MEIWVFKLNRYFFLIYVYFINCYKVLRSVVVYRLCLYKKNLIFYKYLEIVENFFYLEKIWK